MQDISAAPSFCPSFSAYFSDGIAHTAARVRLELAGDPGSPTQSQNDDFEFAILPPDPDPPSQSLFPIFNRDLSVNADDGKRGEDRVDDDKLAPLRISFGNLFVDDKDPPSSSSSSLSSSERADELEGVPSDTFCRWSPRQSVNSSPSGCRKSNSTGSSSKNSKRWRLTFFILRRSKSDGKEISSSSSSVFPNSSDSTLNSETKKREERTTEEKKRGKKVSPSQLPSPSPHEVLYGRNKGLKEGERRRTYLPYRKDLVGILANTHGLSRNIAPF